MMIVEEQFDTRELASVAAANQIEAALQRDLKVNDTTALIVSGGSTPKQCLEDLSNRSLPWNRVVVLASDERWVPPSHVDSNEKMLRETLLARSAQTAQWQPLFRPNQSIDQACQTMEVTLRALSRPAPCALLGMGEDGHFASLFPDYSGLQEATDPSGSRLCVPVTTAASPHRRISLTLAALLRSEEILLLIFGAAKRRILKQAKSDPDRYPVSSLFHQDQTPVRVIWAP